MTDLDERRTARYRFYDSAGGPLYFGIGVDPESRWLAHRSQEWWPLVDHARTRVDWYANRAEAKAAEKAAIETEQPPHNREHATYHEPRGIGTTEMRARLADVLNDAVLGQITFITSRGRRIAAVIPAPVAEELWRKQAHDDAPPLLGVDLRVPLRELPGQPGERATLSRSPRTARLRVLPGPLPADGLHTALRS